MDKNELLEELKNVVAGGPTGASRANEDDVTANVVHKFDNQSRRLVVEVSLKASAGVTIENFANGLMYFIDGGKGSAPAIRGVRGWGVAEGPVIQSGIDVIVAENGSHSASWSVGTFVQTSGGYKIWSKSEKFKFEA
jgi:hypothetical protein